MIKRTLAAMLVAGSACAADFPAQLDWSQRVELAAPLTGMVDSVNVQPGQTVRKGDVLAALDQTVFKANLMEARADIDRLTNEEADAKRELDRANELYARTVSSTSELDAARLRHARATSLLNAAQARVERARRQLDETELRAPFDAVVLDRLAEPGMAVAGGCQPPALLVVARADEMVARAQLTADRAAYVKLGGAASVIVNGQAHAATIRAVRARSNGQYWAEAVLPRPSALVGGMAATLRLP